MKGEIASLLENALRNDRLGISVSATLLLPSNPHFSDSPLKIFLTPHQFFLYIERYF